MSSPIPQPALLPSGPRNALQEAYQRMRNPAWWNLLLNGASKAIIVPWYGNLDRDPESFDPANGDGHPVLWVPDDPCLAQFPRQYAERNVRMAVPAWLVNPEPTEGGELPQSGTPPVIGVGYWYPVLAAWRLDVYGSEGHYRGRVWIRTFLTPTGNDALDVNACRARAKDWEAEMHAPPLEAPVFDLAMLRH